MTLQADLRVLVALDQTLRAVPTDHDPNVSVEFSMAGLAPAYACEALGAIYRRGWIRDYFPDVGDGVVSVCRDAITPAGLAALQLFNLRRR